eukprot:8590081-Lingulodinium_polyedra.AAC.1
MPAGSPCAPEGARRGLASAPAGPAGGAAQQLPRPYADGGAPLTSVAMRWQARRRACLAADFR